MRALFCFPGAITHVVYARVMRLNRRAFSVIAISVGRRSMLEAPKNPAMPWVRESTYCASSGSAIGPP